MKRFYDLGSFLADFQVPFLSVSKGGKITLTKSPTSSSIRNVCKVLNPLNVFYMVEISALKPLNKFRRCFNLKCNRKFKFLRDKP